MPLRKSPRGLISPYTREGVTGSLKKTAKESFLMKQAAKELDSLASSLQSTEPSLEQAEDAMVETELLAMQLAASSKASVKILRKALAKVKKYRLENTE